MVLLSEESNSVISRDGERELLCLRPYECCAEKTELPIVQKGLIGGDQADQLACKAREIRDRVPECGLGRVVTISAEEVADEQTVFVRPTPQLRQNTSRFVRRIKQEII